MANTTLSVLSRLQQAVALVGQVCQHCPICLRWQLPAGWSEHLNMRRCGGLGKWAGPLHAPRLRRSSKANRLQHAAIRRLQALCLAWLCIRIGLSELISWMMNTICQGDLQSKPQPAKRVPPCHHMEVLEPLFTRTMLQSHLLPLCEELLVNLPICKPRATQGIAANS